MKKVKKIVTGAQEFHIVVPDFAPPYHKLWGICSFVWADNTVHFSDRDYEPMRPFYLENVLTVAVKNGYKYVQFWYLAPDDSFVQGEHVPLSFFVA